MAHDLADKICQAIDRWQGMHPKVTLAEIHRAVSEAQATLLPVTTCIDCSNPLTKNEVHFYKFRCEPCEEMWLERMRESKQ